MRGRTDEQELGSLIRALDKIEGLHRIRYMTSHPNDMTEGLIAAHGDVEKLMPFLHLPVQSGSDRILKAMNRSHSRDSYLRIIDRVRAARPDIAFSGDFIVGFPGESDADFEETLSIVREVGYAQAYSFKYSPRPGTPAADDGRSDSGRSRWTSGSNACRRIDRRTADSFQPENAGQAHRSVARKTRQARRPVNRQIALAAIGACACAGAFHRRRCRGRNCRFWTTEFQRRTAYESSRLNGQKGASATWRHVPARTELRQAAI